MSALPVTAVQQLGTQPEEERWLIEGLWAEEAVGIVGGEPKCCKSILALQIAVSVASGAACLGRFRVRRRGRVLFFAAEDALVIVRRRVEAISNLSGLEFASLDIQVITAPSVRLDLEEDRKQLEATIAQVQPTLLVLDPFVRLHRIDENLSGDVAPLLAYLRDLQRQYRLAVLVVHHAKKGAARARPGQALRGSSEFHAWGDSNLYLRRQREQILLSTEHRAHPSIGDISLQLCSRDGGLGLEIVDSEAANDNTASSPDERIESILRDRSDPLAHAELRKACRMRTGTFCQSLARLVDQGRVIRAEDGYVLSAT